MNLDKLHENYYYRKMMSISRNILRWVDYNTANEPINTRSLLHRTLAFFNQQRTKSNFKLFYFLQILLRSLDTGPQFLMLGFSTGIQKKQLKSLHIYTFRSIIYWDISKNSLKTIETEINSFEIWNFIDK